MTATVTRDLLGIATRNADATRLTEVLAPADLLHAPDPDVADLDAESWAAQLVDWRHAQRSSTGRHSNVVVVATGGGAAEAVISMTSESWRRGFEMPFTLWFTALQLAADLCEDGGSVVVVLDRPASLDCAGYGPATALAEGLANVVRSLAFAQGERGVRANAITWPGAAWMAPEGSLPGAPPPLSGYPGSIEAEVAGAVRLLLSDEAAGITGTTLRADCGRSWL